MNVPMPVEEQLAYWRKCSEEWRSRAAAAFTQLAAAEKQIIDLHRYLWPERWPSAEVADHPVFDPDDPDMEFHEWSAETLEVVADAIEGLARLVGVDR